MSDNSDQPRGGYDPADPWAPPNRDGVELSKPATPAPAPQDRPPVHDQPTMTAMPTGEVPPPPVAPGGPATGSYGYPTPPPVAAPAPSGYGYPGYPGYGAGAPAGYGQPGWQQAAPANGMGTAAMVLGIIAVAGFCMYGLGIVLGILALVFGVIARKKVQRGEANNGGMATAGIVLGAIGILVSSVFLGFIIWAITQSEDYQNDSDDPFSTSLVIERR